MKYKFSKYNICYLKKDVYLIFNTLQWKIVAVNQHDYEMFHEEDKVQLNKRVDTCLKDYEMYGLIVREDVNEDTYVEYKINEAKYDNDLCITLVPTEACNFRCIYCYQNHENNYITDEVINKIYRFFERNIARYKRAYIEWFGGEPLLMKHLVITMSKRIKEICKSHGVPIVFTMTTNGYELDEETFADLIKNNVLYYQITIDGDKSHHDKSRPHATKGGSYDTIMNNLKNIRDHSQSRLFRVVLRMNISSDNKDSVANFEEVFQQEFGADSRFGLTYDYVKDWGGENIKKHKGILMTEEEVGYLLGQEQNLYDDINESMGNRMCYAAKKHGFVINYDGTIKKCAKSMHDPDVEWVNNIGYIDHYGHLVLKEQLVSQWNANFEKQKKCDGCKWLPWCQVKYCPVVGIRKESRCGLNSFYLKNMEQIIFKNYELGKYIYIGDGE